MGTEKICSLFLETKHLNVIEINNLLSGDWDWIFFEK